MKRVNRHPKLRHFLHRKVRQALPGRLLLPIQPSLLDGWDDRTDRQCGLLLYAAVKTGSQGRGGLWVIKIDNDRDAVVQAAQFP